jgi:putative ABC transport system permease protein
MNWLTQILTITAMNLRNLGERKTSSIVAVVGIAGVVAILVGVLSMREGFRATLELSGSDDVAIVLRGGSNDEMSSGLTLDATRIIADASGVARAGDTPLSSPELYVVVDVPMRSTGTAANVPLRGVSALAPQLRQHFKLVSGHLFTPGRFEIMVGRGAALQFAGLDLGKHVRWGNTDWEVVGIFEDAGSVSESEVWTDATVLQGAYQRGSSYQSVRVKLANSSALQGLKDALSTDPRLNVHVYTEREYYAAQAKTLSTLISSVGYTVAVLMGIGAIFAALNTMYSAVAARTREIATLRALGFGAGPVVVSVLAEALALGLIGALLGSALAYFGFNGIRTSTLNWSSFSQITFAFAVTPKLLVQGLCYALILAFIGGVMPGWRAARLPITTGLREL